MTKYFKDNFLYPLKDQQRYDDELGEGYGYALTCEGAEGTWIADCWIVNAQEERHPGYAHNPTPMLCDQVEIDEGMASATHYGDGMSSLMGGWRS